jgi:hypothetical protein
MTLLGPENLHDYQRKAINHQCTHAHSMMWVDMGLGKTTITLTSIVHLLAQGFLRGVVVVAPIRVVRLVWRKEASKWSHLKHLKFSVVSGNKDQRTRALLQKADVYLVNYDVLEWLADTIDTYFVRKDRPLPFNGIVWDEVGKMKNSNTDRVKAFKRIQPHFVWATGLTGTPASNGYKDLHGQYLVVDGGQRLGVSKTQFRTRFYKKAGPYKEVPYDDTEETIKNLIGDITLEMSAEDYNPLPNLIVNDVGVEMPPDLRAKYDQLEREFFTVLDSGKEIEVFNKASLTNKCIAEGTEVMTARGWVSIERLTGDDVVWDGVEWVNISGVVYNGIRRVVDLWGVRMTPDHKVLTTHGWKEAHEVINDKSSNRPDRASVRAPAGGPTGGQRADNRLVQGCYLEGGVRLRERGRTTEFKSSSEASTEAQVMRMSSWRDYRPARSHRNSTVDDLAEHAVTMLGPVGQGLAQLRGAGRHCLSEMGRIIRGVLGRHARRIQPEHDARTQGRERELHCGELSLGKQAQASKQYPTQCDHSNAHREDHRGAGGSSIQPIADHHIQADRSGLARREIDYACVYDVINAGPRQRFTVRGRDGNVFIAHNCLQFSNGSVYPIPGMPLWEHIHDIKLDALEEILDEAQGSPVLCSYAYRSDAERIMTRFKSIDPINLTECKSEYALNSAMARWASGDCRLMIGHPASMGHGIDGLQKTGRTLVWFGLNWSLDLYDQFNARIRRQGQGAPVVCHRILTLNTLDQAQAMALDDKATNQKSLMNAVKRYREQRGV